MANSTNITVSIEDLQELIHIVKNSAKRRELFELLERTMLEMEIEEQE